MNCTPVDFAIGSSHGHAEKNLRVHALSIFTFSVGKHILSISYIEFIASLLSVFMLWILIGLSQIALG